MRAIDPLSMRVTAVWHRPHAWRSSARPTQQRQRRAQHDGGCSAAPSNVEPGVDSPRRRRSRSRRITAVDELLAAVPQGPADAAAAAAPGQVPAEPVWASELCHLQGILHDTHRPWAAGFILHRCYVANDCAARAAFRALSTDEWSRLLQECVPQAAAPPPRPALPHHTALCVCTHTTHPCLAMRESLLPQAASRPLTPHHRTVAADALEWSDVLQPLRTASGLKQLSCSVPQRSWLSRRMCCLRKALHACGMTWCGLPARRARARCAFVRGACCTAAAPAPLLLRRHPRHKQGLRHYTCATPPASPSLMLHTRTGRCQHTFTTAMHMQLPSSCPATTVRSCHHHHHYDHQQHHHHHHHPVPPGASRSCRATCVAAR